MKRFKSTLLAIALLLLLTSVLPSYRGPVSNPGGGATINSDLPPIDTY